DDRKVILSGLANVADPGALKLVEPLLENAEVKAEAKLAADKISAALKKSAPATAKTESKAKPKPDAPEAFSPRPTLADVAYGKHPKQVLHFWKAESDKPTPLVMFIHGGGWTGGDRSSGLGGLLPTMLKS